MLRKVLIHAALLASGLVGVGLFHTPAVAKDRAYAYVLVYYSDAAKTQVVGRETLYCEGDTESYGTATAYYRYYNGMCP